MVSARRADGAPNGWEKQMAEPRKSLAARTVTIAIAAAALLAAGLGGVALARAGGAGRGAGAGDAAVAADAAVAGDAARVGAPGYYIEQGIPQRGTLVRATATGRVVARVVCPGGATVGQYVPASHQTFFLPCQTSAGGMLIYRFRLTRSGQVVGYQLVHGGVLSSATDRLAASADGSTLAVMVPSGGPGGEVVVINTRTGAHAAWRDGSAGPGVMRLRIFQLALTGNGRELVVFGTPKCLKGSPGNVCRASGEQARAVSPAGTGGSLSSSRLIMRQSAITSLREGYINYVTITPDGRSLLAAVVSGGARANGGFVAVDQVSAVTGRQTRQLYRMNTGNGFSYQFVSADASGRYVLFDAGSARTSVNGWIDRGKLIRLRPAGNGVGYEAWSGR